MDPITASLASIGSAIGSFFTGAASGISSAVEKVASAAASVPATAAKGAGTVLSGLSEVGDAAAKIGNSALDAGGKVVNLANEYVMKPVGNVLSDAWDGAMGKDIVARSAKGEIDWGTTIARGAGSLGRNAVVSTLPNKRGARFLVPYMQKQNKE